MVNFKAISAASLAVAAVGIVIQILAGNVPDYPAVPPGLVILVVAAAIVGFAPWRWAPVVGIVASAFLLIGLFAAGQATRLVEVEKALDTAGLWVQIVAVVAALATGVLALVRRPMSA
ncbi:MAG: hypothetical protein ACRCYU_21790 [Nocardioides sp.]